MKKGIVKCSNWESENFYEKFEFLSYFYLHGKAESINGFDCCEGNIEVFSNILSMSTRIVTLWMANNKTYDCLLFSTVSSHRMSGLICLIDDLEAIESAYNYYSKKPSLSMYEHDEKYLEENYPETRLLISKLRRLDY
jgi:hypothetical protein